MHHCAVSGCKNRRRKGGQDFFFLFPKDSETRKKWLRLCGRNDIVCVRYHKVCSKHFDPSAYERNLKYELLGQPAPRNQIRLKPEAIPTLHLPSTTETSASPDKSRTPVFQESQPVTPPAVPSLLLPPQQGSCSPPPTGNRDPLSLDLVPSPYSHMSTQEQEQRMRAMVVSARRETMERRHLSAEYKAAAAKALTTLGVSSVKGFGNTNSTTIQDGNAWQHSLNEFVVDVQGPTLTIASVRSDNVNNPSGSFVSNVLDPDLIIGSVTSKNVNNPSDSFVNNVLDPDLTIALVKSETVSSPSDGLGQALDINSSIAVKSDINFEDHALDYDSCIAVSLEKIDSQSQNFVKSVDLENVINPSVTLVDEAQNADSHLTTDRSTMTDVHDSYVKSLELECQALRSKCHDLEDKKNRLSLSEEAFQDNDAVKYYTGLPTFEILMGTFGLISGYLKDQSSLTKFQQYIMTLLHIRLNHSMEDLAYRFDVSGSTVSKIFHTIIHVCTTRLVSALVFWPDREKMKNNFPVALKNEFSRCTAIISCLEIPIERSRSSKVRKQTYSHRKAYTMKYLIAVSPQGLISYISKGWGGSYSDIHIAEHCGILEKISPGDEILADKGFNNGTCVGLYGAALFEGKKELCMIEVEETINMAEVQSYVEKVMGVVHAARQNYVMLQSAVSLSLLEEFANKGLTALDKVVWVACALSSVSESLMAKS